MEISIEKGFCFKRIDDPIVWIFLWHLYIQTICKI